MALPAFRAASTKASGTGAVTPALPSGMSAGDIVILCATTIAGGSISITANGSVGTWTEITSSGLDVTGGEKLYVWWGRWSSGTTGPTVTPGGDHCCAGTVAYSGCVPNGSPIGVKNITGVETTSDTSFSFATALTTGENDCMCICVCSQGNDSNTASIGNMANSSLANLANRQDFCTNANGGGGFSLQEGQKATAGTMGTFSSTLSASSPKAYIAFSLRPIVAINVAAGVGSITLTGFAATVSVGNNKNVNAGLGQLTLVGQTPTVSLSDNKNVSPGLGQLSIAGFSPIAQINVISYPGKGDLIVLGFEPSINISDNISVIPGPAQLSLSGFSPNISLSDNKNITPDNGTIILNGFSPQLDLSINTNTGQIIIDGLTPSIIISDNKNLLPGAGEIIFDGFQPSLGGNLDILPGTGPITITGFEPKMDVVFNADTGKGDLVVTGFSPSIHIDINISPNTGNIVINGFDPIVTGDVMDKEFFPGLGNLIIIGFAPQFKSSKIIFLNSKISSIARNRSIINESSLNKSNIGARYSFNSGVDTELKINSKT